jgi:hypothetical protein
MHTEENDNDKNKNKDKDDKDDRTVAEVLVDLISENSNQFFKDQYEKPWVLVHNKDHHELIRITGERFKRYISKLYYDRERRVPYSEAIGSATSVLRARAEFEGKTIPLSLRVT